MNKSEKILFAIFLLLSSVIILYNILYIPSLPNADIIKKELIFQEIDSEDDGSPDKVIDINSASLDDLKKIPGIGDSTAKKIIDYREQNGGFSYKSEIMNISGIGQKKFENIKKYISVGEKTNE